MGSVVRSICPTVPLVKILQPLLISNKPPALKCHHLRQIDIWHRRSRDHRIRNIIWFPINFLVSLNQPSTLHGCQDMVLQRSFLATLTFCGYVKSSVTWPLDSHYVVSCKWSVWTGRLSRTAVELLSFKDIGVTTLTFLGHVKSSVTSPLDSQYAVSLSVVSSNQPSVSHGSWDIKVHILYWVHDFNLLGSRDVIGHMAIGRVA